MKKHRNFAASRRHFLKQSALVTMAFAGLRNAFQPSAHGAESSGTPRRKIEDDFYGVLDLPPEFSYTVFSEVGERMDDGLLVPGKHDGMGAFAGRDGRTILIRNHEMDVGATEGSPYGSRRTLMRKIDRKK